MKEKFKVKVSTDLSSSVKKALIESRGGYITFYMILKRTQLFAREAFAYIQYNDRTVPL